MPQSTWIASLSLSLGPGKTLWLPPLYPALPVEVASPPAPKSDSDAAAERADDSRTGAVPASQALSFTVSQFGTLREVLYLERASKAIAARAGVVFVRVSLVARCSGDAPAVFSIRMSSPGGADGKTVVLSSASCSSPTWQAVELVALAYCSEADRLWVARSGDDAELDPELCCFAAQWGPVRKSTSQFSCTLRTTDLLPNALVPLAESLLPRRRAFSIRKDSLRVNKPGVLHVAACVEVKAEHACAIELWARKVVSSGATTDVCLSASWSRPGNHFSSVLVESVVLVDKGDFIRLVVRGTAPLVARAKYFTSGGAGGSVSAQEHKRGVGPAGVEQHEGGSSVALSSACSTEVAELAPLAGFGGRAGSFSALHAVLTTLPSATEALTSRISATCPMRVPPAEKPPAVGKTSNLPFRTLIFTSDGMRPGATSSSVLIVSERGPVRVLQRGIVRVSVVLAVASTTSAYARLMLGTRVVATTVVPGLGNGASRWAARSSVCLNALVAASAGDELRVQLQASSVVTGVPPSSTTGDEVADKAVQSPEGPGALRVPHEASYVQDGQSASGGVPEAPSAGEATSAKLAPSVGTPIQHSEPVVVEARDGASTLLLEWSPTIVSFKKRTYAVRRTVMLTKRAGVLKELGLDLFSAFVRTLPALLSRPRSDAAGGAGGVHAVAGATGAAAQGVSVEALAALAGPLERVGDVLWGQPSLTLFSEWAPPKEAELRVVSCSLPESHRSATNAHAVLDDSADCLTFPVSGVEFVPLTIEFAGPCTLSSLTIKFSAREMPEQFTIHVRLASKGSNFEYLTTVREGSVSAKKRFKLGVVAEDVTGVKLVFSGKHKTNSGDTVSVHRVKLVGPIDAGRPIPSALHAIYDLRKWMAAFSSVSAFEDEVPSEGEPTIALVRSSGAPSLRDAYFVGVAALQSLAWSSGSLSVLLELCLALVRPTAERQNRAYAAAITAGASAAVARSLAVRVLPFTHSVDFDHSPLADLVVTRDHVLHGRVASLVKRMQEVATLREALQLNHKGREAEAMTFDPSAKSPTVTITGNTIRSTASGNSYCCLSTGYTHGVATWSFRLDEDTSSQCTCFGVATKPVTNCGYENARDMWLIRAYSGGRYERSRNIGTSARIHKTDTIAFRLDMDEGTLHATIQNAQGATRWSGVAFGGLQGKELFPVVTFYASGRAVSLLKSESNSGAPAQSSMWKWVADMVDYGHYVGYGSVGRGSSLGYDSCVVIAEGRSGSKAVSLHPPANTAAAAAAVEEVLYSLRRDGGRASMSAVSVAAPRRSRNAESESDSGVAIYADVDAVGDTLADATVAIRAADDRDATQHPPDDPNALVDVADVALAASGSDADLQVETAFAFLRVRLNGVADLFNAAVGINGDVSASKFDRFGSTVFFEVWGDGRMLWRSPPVTSVNTWHTCGVSVLRIHTLELRTRAAGSNRYAHAVWLDPRVRTAGNWPCSYCGQWNDASLFECGVRTCARERPDIVALMDWTASNSQVSTLFEESMHVDVSDARTDAAERSSVARSSSLSIGAVGGAGAVGGGGGGGGSSASAAPRAVTPSAPDAGDDDRRSGVALASPLLAELASLIEIYTRDTRHAETAKAGSVSTLDLEQVFALEASAETFSLLHKLLLLLLRPLRARLAAATSPPAAARLISQVSLASVDDDGGMPSDGEHEAKDDEVSEPCPAVAVLEREHLLMALAVLRLMSGNLVRLATSGVNPESVGLSVAMDSVEGEGTSLFDLPWHCDAVFGSWPGLPALRSVTDESKALEGGDGLPRPVVGTAAGSGAVSGTERDYASMLALRSSLRRLCSAAGAALSLCGAAGLATPSDADMSTSDAPERQQRLARSLGVAPPTAAPPNGTIHEDPWWAWINDRLVREAREVLASGGVLFAGDTEEPSPEVRAQQLTRGAGVLEFHMAWGDHVPAVKEAWALEAVALHLQLSCRRLRWRSRLLGAWPTALHLVMEVPTGADASAMLSEEFPKAFRRATGYGFKLSAAEHKALATASPFSMMLMGAYVAGKAAGLMRVSVVEEEHMDWDRRLRFNREGGVAWVRVYPRDAATFDGVVSAVGDYLPRRK